MVSLLAGAFLLLQFYEHEFCGKNLDETIGILNLPCSESLPGFLLVNNPYIPTLLTNLPHPIWGIWKRKNNTHPSKITWSSKGVMII